MSDGISTSPDAIQPDTRVSETVSRPSTTHEDHGNASAKKQGDQGSRDDQNQKSGFDRDPAISIAASVADLHKGDRLVETISRLDPEGRPIIDSARASYALKPDAGLKPGDALQLVLEDTGHDLTAHLLKHNAQSVDPPVLLSLTVIAMHQTPGDAPSASIDGYGVKHSYHPAANTPTGPQTVTMSTTNAVTTPSIANTIASSTAAGTEVPATTTSVNTSAANVLAGQTDRAPEGSTALLLAQAGAVLADGSAVTLGPVSRALADLIPTAALQILSIEPLSIDRVRALHLPAQSFARADTPMARVTTGMAGGFGPVLYTSVTAAQGLLGHHILVETPPQADTSTAQNPAQPPRLQATPARLALTLDAAPADTGSTNESVPKKAAGTPTYRAGLTVDIQPVIGQYAPVSDTNSTGRTTAQPSQVPATGAPRPALATQLSIAPKDAAAPLGSLIVQKAIITATRLAPEGPIVEQRLGTAIGSLTVTLPASLRLMAGDAISLTLPTPSGEATQTSAGGTVTAAEAQALANAGPEGTQAPVTSEATSEALAGAKAQDSTAHQAAIQAAQITTAGAASGPTHPPTLAQPGLGNESFEALASQMALTSDVAMADALSDRSTAGGPKLTNSLLFMMAALGGGHKTSKTAWFPKPSGDGGAARLAEQINSEIGRLMSGNMDSQPGEWRAYQLPFDVRDGAVSILSLLVRDETPKHGQKGGQQGEQDTGDPQKRFIVDVGFSVIGDIQLDGTIADRHFDLTLRSAKALPPGLGSELVSLFADALEANAYTGALKLRPEDAFLVDVAAVLADLGGH